MKTFFDSSSLAKRYVRERGSDAVQSALDQATEAAVSLICPPEIVSALSRLRRQGAISGAQFDLAKKALFDDLDDMSVRAVTVPLVHSAIDLIERHPLRTLDALHVAGALEWKADLFVSSDRLQLAAAAKAGLRVLLV